jgi:hypothetical protein
MHVFKLYYHQDSTLPLYGANDVGGLEHQHERDEIAQQYAG